MIASVVILSAFLMALKPLRSPDVWHHVKSGWLVAQNGGPATVDVFSCTAQGQPWIQYEWLAQLIFYGIFNTTGVTGLVLFRAAVVALTAFLLLAAARARRGTGWAATGAAVALALCAASGRFFTRPEIFTWLIFAGWLVAVEKVRQGRQGFLLLPALLMIPWVNMHGAWPAGLAWLGLMAAGETARLLLRPESALSRRTVGALWGALALALAATLANPYGSRIWEVPFKLSRAAEVTTFIAEWRRPDWAHWLDPQHIGAWILLAALLAAPLAVAIPDALVILFFGALSLTARRHLALAMIVVSPILAAQLSFLWNWSLRRAPPLTARFKALAGVLATVAVCALLTLLALGFRLERAGIGMEKGIYPVGAAAFIADNHLGGNLYNSYAFGNYLLFRLYPGNRVFIDGRVDMYGESVLRLYNRVRQAAPARQGDAVASPDWRKILADRSIDIAVVETAREPDRPLLEALHRSDDWALVYWDDLSAVYVERSPRRRDFLEHAYVYSVPPGGFDPARLRGPGLAGKAGDVIRAQKDYERKLGEDPDCALALQGLAECFHLRGLHQEEFNLLQRAAALHPEVAGLQYNLGQASLEVGRLKEAEEAFRRAIQLGEHQVEAYVNLGGIFQNTGRPEKAQSCYRKALRLDPKNWLAYWNLSRVYEGIGDLDEALASAEEVVRLRPNDARARQRVEELHRRKETGRVP